MITLGVVVAVSSFVAALAAVLLLRLAPTLWLQLAGLAVLSASVPLVAVLLSGWVMFHMGADTKILAVAAGSATAATAAALVLARLVTHSIGRVNAAAAELSAGNLSARAPVGGPAEIAGLATAFNTMAANVEQLFDVRRELVAWASHDLRAPLASMQAMLEALEDGLVEPALYLPALREQTRRLAAIVDDLFELARIDAGALTLELSKTELAALVESTLSVLTPQAGARNVGVESYVMPHVAASVAPEKIERVLLNLLTNALRHTPTDGSVAVHVEQVHNEVLVRVEDTGDGLAPEARERMFERFWRSDEARSGSGAGLGLAIARALVEAHGGRIWAENRVEGGARVAFTLPVG